MSKPIIFYDIANELEGGSWSLNTWKTRYVLNYKNIPYQTVWIEYADIKSKMLELGAAPTSFDPDGSPHYTVPTIQDPNTGAVVTDSFNIAEYLEKRYPESPKLFPAGSAGFQAVFCALTEPPFFTTFPHLLLGFAQNTLTPASQTHFKEIWENFLGTTLESESEGAEEQWKKFQGWFDKLEGWYAKNGSGPFITGDQLTFADIVVAVWFTWYGNLVGRDTKEWREMLTWNEGRWSKLVDALKPYEAGN